MIRLRFMATACYAVVVFALLSLTYRGDPFCGPSFVLPILNAGVMLLLWDAFGTAAGIAARSTIRRVCPDLEGGNWISIAITMLIVGGGFISVPSWIYAGYGHFRFEDWADVSCLFTEGYVYAFAGIVAPVLTLTTFLREILINRR